MKSALRDAGLKKVRVSSAGTGAIEGMKPSPNAAAVARELGLSLAGFRSRPLTPRRVHGADLILTMTRGQWADVTGRWPEVGEKTYVIGDFSRSGRESIDDPLGGSRAMYYQCANVLQDEVGRVMRRIRPRLVSRRKGKATR
jgi:protein-tyrosine-phosphatase